MLVVSLSSTALKYTSTKTSLYRCAGGMGRRRTLITDSESRKLIVGLGNPGNKFNGTRHNIGFDLVDKISELYDIPLTKSKYNSYYGVGSINGQSVILVKPQTFMNLSGQSVKPWVDFYKIKFEDCLIIHDAADIPVGGFKLKIGGKSGGQNGVNHIIERLGSQQFPRLKLGVGRPDRDGTDLATWVLSKFPSIDSEKVDSMLSKAKDCLVTWLEHGPDKAMTDYNAESGTKQKKVKKPKTASTSSPSVDPSSSAIEATSIVHEG